MTGPTNGHGPMGGGSINRTPSFTPITPVVKEKVWDVASRLSEVEAIIDGINLQSTANEALSPTMGDLQKEIDRLKVDIGETRVSQTKKIDALRKTVKNDVKDHITTTMQADIERKIRESVRDQVVEAVAQWGELNETKKFVEGLKGVIQENDALLRDANIRLDNSRSRHENSTLDEYADFETELSKIKMSDGNVSGVYPRTLKVLFSYDDARLLQLLDEYNLQKLETHLENLNRFLAFIGLRFSVPEQSLEFLDYPPSYTSQNVLESPEDEKTELEKPLLEPVAMNNHPEPAQEQKQPDQGQTEFDKPNVRQDRVRQGIELSTFGPQPPAVATSHRPQHTTPTHPPRQTNPIPPLHPPSQPSATSNPPGTKGVSGWFRSIAGDY